MKWQSDILVLAGALLGGLVGHLAFMWLIQQGFYALILPGGLLGLGASIPKHGRLYLAVICGMSAGVISFVSEWRAFPFVADESFWYFVTHCFQLKPMTWIMMAIGTAMGFWIPFNRSREYSKPRP